MSLPDRRPTTIGQPIHQQPPIAYLVEPYQPGPIAYVPDPYNPSNSVAVPAEYVRAPAVYQPRDLSPQPVLDPLAQRVLAAGVGGGALAAGAGWGAAQFVGEVAAVGSGTFVWLALLLGAARTLPAVVTRRPRVHHETHIHSTNRWLGHNTTNINHR